MTRGYLINTIFSLHRHGGPREYSFLSTAPRADRLPRPWVCERTSRNSVFILVGVLASSFYGDYSVAGTSARVLKAKGNKAIIRIDSGERLQRGDRIEIEFEEEINTVSSGPSQRRNFLGGEFEFDSGSTETKRDSVPSTTTEQTNMAMTGLFGWNKGLYEYGGKVVYGTTTVDGETTLDGSFGGFYEYNFQEPNKVGVKFVTSAGASLNLRLKEQDSSAGNGFQWSLYVGGKYFAFSETLAVTGFLAYESDSVTYANGRTDSYSGTSLLIGLRQYL